MARKYSQPNTLVATTSEAHSTNRENHQSSIVQVLASQGDEIA